MEAATAAAACVLCESSRKYFPKARMPSDMAGTIKSASTAFSSVTKIDLSETQKPH